MTRITKLYRKTHEEASGFEVTPLVPKKSSQKRNSGVREYSSEKKPKLTKDQRQEKYSAGGAERSESRRLRRIRERNSNITCFVCRQTGHPAKDCPKADESGVGICYNCGSTEHTSKDCRKPADGNPFSYASCFICNGQGHLASKCPQNQKGLYPNGGGCRYCGSINHLAKDCRPATNSENMTTIGKIDLEQGGDDDDVFVALHKIQKEKAQPKPASKPKKKVVTF
ncbi:hypothetical protein K7432_000276 [Basidiobolus ranarum]|uniref:CCHC-type domain-containing protein n=1 Tax=Basidiobolus ranarum TaxID=34480 RepID=A0ABR2WBG3_9FUNG